MSAQAGMPAAAPRVVVGLSGGVDSSVAAALAVERGFEAVGVAVHQLAGASRCCSLEDARAVCDALGMRFYAVNRVERFAREILEPFADAYLAGRTPNPCVACNRGFKFAVLLERARWFGAGRVVTGHYARVEKAEAGDGSPRWRLLRGRDRAKDQSYFLFQLDQETLARVWFPLGALTKAEVRRLARERGLPTAEAPESQEICFVPRGDYAAVVEALRPGAARPGEVVDEEDRVLGRHGGVHRFTVGQRRGLGVAAGRRVYVREIDAASGRVRVGSAARSGEARLERVSWVAGTPPPGPVRARAQVRHRAAAVPAWVEPLPAGGARLRFDTPEAAVAPGQAAVLYDHPGDEEVLGGGFVAETAA